MEKIVDLHVHSHISDGSYSPAGLAELAKERGLAAFALTDHDSMLGCEEAASQVAGFKIVVAVDVGGYAYGRTFEVNSGEGDSLAVLVRHASAHLGRLCLTDDAEQQQKGCQ